MPDNANQATLWAGIAASLLVGLGGLMTAWFSRRSTVDATRETGRQFDLTTLIETMQEEMASMRAEMKQVKQENRECLADRDQMRGEIRRLTRRLEGVEQQNGGH